MATAFMFSDYIATVRSFIVLPVPTLALALALGAFAVVNKLFLGVIRGASFWLLLTAWIVLLSLELEHLHDRHGLLAFLCLIPAVLIGHEMYLRLTGR
jgi:hypothetical protein